MNAMQSDLKYSVSLTAAAHHQAEAISAAQLNPQRAKQCYLNSLVIYAVEFYLNCWGLKPDRSMSHSHDPLHLQLSTVADLVIPGLGRIECCVVLPGEEQLQILPDAWKYSSNNSHNHRIAYIAVQLDQELKRATLRGFIETAKANSEPIPFSALKPIDTLPFYLSNLQATESAPQIELSQWFRHHFVNHWQALESWLTPAHPISGLAFRSPKIATGQKFISFDSGAGSLELSMAIQLIAKDKHRSSIIVQLLSPHCYLPPGLTLSILNDQGKIFLSQVTEGKENIFRLQPFTGQKGEQFSLHILCNKDRFKEKFQI